MKGSKVIVAINKDRQPLIFGDDCGLVGDLFAIASDITDAL
jgi:electron transfer flavoprotein alpha subunit